MKAFIKTFWLFGLCAASIEVASLINKTVGSKDNNPQSVNEYIANEPNWTKEQYARYYSDNKIMPKGNPPTEAQGGRMRYQSDVLNHLNKRFPGNTWSFVPHLSKDVSFASGYNPVDVDENDLIIQQAKAMSSISSYDYIGCGVLALVDQINYLANALGYNQFFTNDNNTTEKRNLYIDIFNKIRSFPGNGEVAHYLNLMGIDNLLGFTIDPTMGTFVFPSDLISGARQLFLDYNINNGVGHEEVDSNGNYKQLIKIHGDALPSTMSLDVKKQSLINAINKGMPVIWWTGENFGDPFDTHFMNIYGYEVYDGIDSTGYITQHTFFKVRVNWGWTTCAYMDSDLLMGTCGLIFFEEQLPKVTVKPTDYGFPQQYNNSPITKNYTFGDTSLITRRLRTGYINEAGISGTGDWHITMSSKRMNAGLAYLEYEFSKKINFIYFDVRLWSQYEGLVFGPDRAALEYKDENGNWVEAINFFFSSQTDLYEFSYLKDRPDRYRFDFPYGTTTFRFISEASNPTNATTNKGRIVIGNLSVVFSTNDESNLNLYVTAFVVRDGSSSFLNFSGHAWIQIYNNSTEKVTIGRYNLRAFEGMTVGLWGNTQHHGVYYNLEYYRQLTELIDKASSSSSSGSSSSGSSSSGSSSSGTSSSSSASSQWSQGSSGLSSWIAQEVHQSLIVSAYSGRVSLTQTAPLSKAADISNIINSHNNVWTINYNCSDFAIQIWNSVSNDHMGNDVIQTPANMFDKVTSRDYFQRERYLMGDRYCVGYYSNEVFHFSTN